MASAWNPQAKLLTFFLFSDLSLHTFFKNNPEGLCRLEWMKKRKGASAGSLRATFCLASPVSGSEDLMPFLESRKQEDETCEGQNPSATRKTNNQQHQQTKTPPYFLRFMRKEKLAFLSSSTIHYPLFLPCKVCLCKTIISKCHRTKYPTSELGARGA